MEGYQETGITIMYMDEAMDSGDMISQCKVKIEKEDNLESLSLKLANVSKDFILEVLPSIIEKTNERISQDKEEVTYAYNIKREEEHLDFNLESEKIYNHIRGLSPSPSANLILDEEEIKVYSSRISNQTYPDKKNGEIVKIYKDGIGIKTKDSEIVLLEIKPFGKKRMLVRDYLNGVKKEELLGKVVR